MTTLAHPELDDHDFGRAVFHVGDFCDWLSVRRLRMSTYPSINDFEFAQVGAILFAIERAASKITADEAKEIVSKDPFLSRDRMASINPVWLVSAEAHRKWRVVIKTAVTAGELQLLDYVSKLPLSMQEKESQVHMQERKSAGDSWKNKAQAMAIAIYREKPAKKDAIAADIAKAFADVGIISATGKPLTADNIARQALTPWKAPRLAKENKKKK